MLHLDDRDPDDGRAGVLISRRIPAQGKASPEGVRATTSHGPAGEVASSVSYQRVREARVDGGAMSRPKHPSSAGADMARPSRAGGTGMVNRLMLWAAENPRLERTIHNNKTFGRIVHRFIAGDELQDALAAARELNAHGIGGIS